MPSCRRGVPQLTAKPHLFRGSARAAVRGPESCSWSHGGDTPVVGPTFAGTLPQVIRMIIVVLLLLPVAHDVPRAGLGGRAPWVAEGILSPALSWNAGADRWALIVAVIRDAAEFFETAPPAIPATIAATLPWRSSLNSAGHFLLCRRPPSRERCQFPLSSRTSFATLACRPDPDLAS